MSVIIGWILLVANLIVMAWLQLFYRSLGRQHVSIGKQNVDLSQQNVASAERQVAIGESLRLISEQIKDLIVIKAVAEVLKESQGD